MGRPQDRTLSQSVRREIGSPMTARFIRSLPFFRTSDVLPAHLADLLQRLEAREGAAASQGAASAR